MSSWPIFSLSDAGVTLYDCEHKTPSALTDGHPYVAIPDLVSGRINFDTARRISDADLATWTRRVKPQGDDVLLTRRGRVGDTAVVPSNTSFAIGQNIVLLRADGSRVAPQYLRWALKGALYDQQVEKYRNVGAVFDSLNCRDILKFELPIPPLDVQARIAEAMAALDEKIMLNHEIASRADALLVAHVQAVQSDLHLAGADPIPLASLGSFINGRAFTKNPTGTGRMVVRIAEMNSGPGPSTVYNELDVAEDHLVRPGDLLFSWSGSLVLQRWFRDEAIVNQHIFKVSPGVAPIWLLYALLHDLLPEFRRIAQDKATTMGHIQRRHLDVGVIFPDRSKLCSLASTCQPLWNRAALAEQQSEIIAKLQDALLPRLTSGEIGLDRAERTV